MQRFLLIVALFVLPCAAQSSDFRCRGSIIGSKFSKADVLAYCGTPTFTSTFTKPDKTLDSPDKTILSCEQVEQWFYNLGPGTYTYTVNFEHGFVSQVTQGQRVPE